MKIYYFLNNISLENFNLFLSKFNQIKSWLNVNDIINKDYSKVWLYKKDQIWDANFLEALSFIEFIAKKHNLTYNQVLDNISWIYDNNFLIYNEEIYISDKNTYSKIDTINQKVYFVTSRDSFTSPFFLILNSISKINKNIKVVKFNNRIEKWPYNDKAYYISKLYKYREKIIGDIIFPFLQNNNSKNIRVLFEFIKWVIWNKVMLKKNFWDMWIWLKAIDLDDLPEDRIEYIREKFFMNWNSYTWVYITKFINIHKEYRVYYRCDDKKDKVEIYSIKNRTNTIWKDIFEKPSFKIYENIEVDWKYMENKNLWKENIDIIIKICKIIKDNCWVLEFFEDENWRKYFCEINSLWWSLMFSWPDEKNMLKYYVDTWKMIY